VHTFDPATFLDPPARLRVASPDRRLVTNTLLVPRLQITWGSSTRRRPCTLHGRNMWYQVCLSTLAASHAGRSSILARDFFFFLELAGLSSLGWYDMDILACNKSQPQN